MTTYTIDFDGTCVDHQYPYICDDVPGAVEALTIISLGGGKLILNTMRSDRAQLAVNWFENYKLPLHGINENPDQKDRTNSPKVYGHHYIDDSAVGCPLIHPEGYERACVDWGKITEFRR